MAKVAFKEYNSGMECLFPSRLDEHIPEESPVRLVNRIVDGMDTSSVLETCDGGGSGSYYPRMMLKVVFYACLNNVYPCRRMEEAMPENIHYMWLSGKQYPSCRTINRFRSNHLKDCINDLFVQVADIPAEMGQVGLDVQYVDGTKIEPVANKYTFVWKKSVEKHKAKLEKQIASILLQIEEGIAADNEPVLKETSLPVDRQELEARIKAIRVKTVEKPA
ncbi:MAG: transposase, partial [Tannerella sp.]|nr:transposase [Tannerella sp.]